VSDEAKSAEDEEMAKVLLNKKGELHVMLDGFDVGLANMVVDRLLKNRSVTFAAADYDHPLKGNVVIKIRGDEPKKELAKALSDVSGEIGKAAKALGK